MHNKTVSALGARSIISIKVAHTKASYAYTDEQLKASGFTVSKLYAYLKKEATRDSLLLPEGAKLVFDGKTWNLMGYAADGRDLQPYAKYFN